MNRRNFLKGFIAATTVAALAPVSLVEVPVTETTRFVSFEEIARITLEKYRPILSDAILTSRYSRSNPFARFYTRDNISVTVYDNGGVDIVEPVIRG